MINYWTDNHTVLLQSDESNLVKSLQLIPGSIDINKTKYSDRFDPIEIRYKLMKAQIYINRDVMAANKKATKETGKIVDKQAIAVRTYKGSIYCKEVKFTAGGKLIQDAENPICSGATIYIQVDDFESLVIDGVEASRSMYEEPLEFEDYFWQFIEDLKANKDENYLAIARRLVLNTIKKLCR